MRVFPNPPPNLFGYQLLTVLPLSTSTTQRRPLIFLPSISLYASVKSRAESNSTNAQVLCFGTGFVDLFFTFFTSFDGMVDFLFLPLCFASADVDGVPFISMSLSLAL